MTELADRKTPSSRLGASASSPAFRAAAVFFIAANLNMAVGYILNGYGLNLSFLPEVLRLVGLGSAFTFGIVLVTCIGTVAAIRCLPNTVSMRWRAWLGAVLIAALTAVGLVMVGLVFGFFGVVLALWPSILLTAVAAALTFVSTVHTVD